MCVVVGSTCIAHSYLSACYRSECDEDPTTTTALTTLLFTIIAATPPRYSVSDFVVHSSIKIYYVITYLHITARRSLYYYLYQNKWNLPCIGEMATRFARFGGCGEVEVKLVKTLSRFPLIIIPLIFVTFKAPYHLGRVLLSMWNDTPWLLYSCCLPSDKFR